MPSSGSLAGVPAVVWPLIDAVARRHRMTHPRKFKVKSVQVDKLLFHFELLTFQLSYRGVSARRATSSVAVSPGRICTSVRYPTYPLFLTWTLCSPSERSIVTR